MTAVVALIALLASPDNLLSPAGTIYAGIKLQRTIIAHALTSILWLNHRLVMALLDLFSVFNL